MLENCVTPPPSFPQKYVIIPKEEVPAYRPNDTTLTRDHVGDKVSMSRGVQQIDALFFRFESRLRHIDRHSATSFVLRFIQNPRVRERRLTRFLTVLQKWKWTTVFMRNVLPNLTCAQTLNRA